MQKQASSEWWKWLVGLVALVALLYFAHGGPEGAHKGPATEPSPTPRPTSSLPDNCWYANLRGGVECDAPRPDVSYGDYLADRYGDEAVREATIEAAIEELWDTQRQEEARAYATAEEHLRREATIEAEIWGSGPVSASPASEVALASASDAAPGAEWALLVNVTDGDSIVVEVAGNSYRVRYIGIDTPEYGEDGFGQATDVNRQLLASGPLRLEKDVSETDQHGRLLRYVFAGDVFVNAELVRLGYAYADTWPPDVKYSDYFVQLQREARDAGRGLWAE